MCGSCEGTTHPGKRWSSTHLIIGTLLVVLIAFLVAGIALRLGGQEKSASGCAHTASESIAYQAQVTRDLGRGPAVLLVDTRRFVTHVRAEAGSGCSNVHQLARDAQTTLRPLCRTCAASLARAFAALAPVGVLRSTSTASRGAAANPRPSAHDRADARRARAALDAARQVRPAVRRRLEDYELTMQFQLRARLSGPSSARGSRSDDARARPRAAASRVALALKSDAGLW